MTIRARRTPRPIVAIVGRPNVGKSSLFNRLVGKPIAIVHDEPGVTRDRHYADAWGAGRDYVLVDTGGFDPESDDPMGERISEQVEIAVQEADVVVCVFDAAQGVTEADRHAANMLRRAKKPVLYVANKADSRAGEADALELYRLGLKTILPISALHGRGIGQLERAIAAALPPLPSDEADAETRADSVSRGEGEGDGDGGAAAAPANWQHDDSAAAEDVDDSATAEDVDNSATTEDVDDSATAEDVDDSATTEDVDDSATAEDVDDSATADEAGVAADAEAEPDAQGEEGQEVPSNRPVRIALIGRPNAGKSSLANRILGEDRLLVDDRPGTTRDAIDVEVEREGWSFVLVDTAGIRRKGKVSKTSSQLEASSVYQAIRAIERCDVAILVCDADAGVAEQDAKILGIAEARGRGIVLALNKLDLLDRKRAKTLEETTRDVLGFVPWASIVPLSAKTGRGVPALLEACRTVRDNLVKRVATGALNRFFEQVLATHPPPTMGSRAPRLFYITQAETNPPLFVVVTNEPDHIHFSYRRYVINQLRGAFGFEGVPVRVVYKKRRRRE